MKKMIGAEASSECLPFTFDGDHMYILVLTLSWDSTVNSLVQRVRFW